MTDYAALERSLTNALRLRRRPVTICMTDTIPDGVPSYDGRSPAGCLFWQEGSERVFATSTRDHELCAIGVHTHNLAEPSASYQSELGEVLKVMAGMEYVREDEVAGIPVLEASKRHVLYAPLSECPMPPDLVLLFVDASQGLVLTEAVQQVDPEAPPAMGRPACAVVPQAMNSGRAAMSLGCCGARAYLDGLSDDISLWALPGAKLEQYTARLVKLAAANETLGRFHELRRRDVEGGASPTIAESLERLGS